MAQATISPYFLAITDMAEEELPYEHQLDEIATQVNVYRADGIAPELFLMPSFLKYFPVVMEPGVLTDVNWNIHFRIICAVTGFTDDVC